MPRHGAFMPHVFVTTLQGSSVPKLRKGLEELGFEFTTPPHTVFSAKKPGLSCTLYKSLKLTIQGKGMSSFLEFYLEPEILQSPAFTYAKELCLAQMDKRPRIGVDEAGKGDYFGPLCIAGVFANEEDCSKLLVLGVKDSKKLSDAQIYSIAPRVVSIVPNYIIRLRPKKYNELYRSFKNLNSLLAWGHASVIERLAAHTGASLAVIDKFGHESLVERALKKKQVCLSLEQNVQGEADVVVAAASILARWAFLAGLEETGKLVHETLPKGAGRHVTAAAKKLVQANGRARLEEVAKLHFKNTLEVDAP